MEPQAEQTSSDVPVPQENIHITSDVPVTTPATAKNPGRVAAGKKLAESNKRAREAKKQQLQQAPNPPPAAASTTTEEKSDSNILGYIIGIGSLIVSAFSVYYQRKAILNAPNRNVPNTSSTTKEQEVQTTPAPQKIKPNVISDIDLKKKHSYIPCLTTSWSKQSLTPPQ